MVILIPIVSNFILTVVSLHNWKKYRDRNFLFVSLFTCAALCMSLLAFLDKYYFRYALPSINLSVAVVWFYNWIKFRQKSYLWISVLNTLVVLTGIYGFYFAKIDLSLPLSQWPITAYFFLGLLLAAFIALIVL